MGLMGLLLLVALDSFHVLAWPLFALGYPLCASIQAIETNSKSDTKKLINYWVCFSLILLFEHSFAKLLECWDLRSELSLFPDIWEVLYVHVLPIMLFFPTSWYIKLTELWNQGSLLVEANREAKVTGPDAFDSLTAFKKLEESKVAQKEINAVATVEKEEVSSRSLTKQVIRQIKPDLALPPNRTYASVLIKNLTVETLAGIILENKANDTATVPGKQHVDASGKLQPKEQSVVSPASAPDFGCVLPYKPYSMSTKTRWTCALCKVTASGKLGLISHFQGRRHGDALEKLKLKIETTKNEIPAVALETCSTPEKKEMATTAASSYLPEKPHSEDVPTPWTCGICRVTVTAEATLVSHLQGRRHKDSCEKLKTLIQAQKGDVPQWWCDICNISCSSEGNMLEHLNGSKHLARTVQLSGDGGSVQA